MRPRARLALPAAALALLAAPAAAPAADDYFLQISGINGSATVEGLPGAIPIDSFSWELSNAASAGGGGTGAGGGKASLSPFQFTKKVDATSPVLFKRVADAKRLKSVRFVALTAGDKPRRALEYCMTNVAVTKFAESGASGEETVKDDVSLEPATFAIQVTPQNPDGSSAAAVVSGWNLVTNTSIGFSDTCGT